jgi:HSP20 family molecular chaperone IbpA
MDPIRTIRLRWVHGAFSDVTYKFRRLQFTHFAPQPWEPAINAYHCKGSVRICVDLAGVDRSEIDLQISPQRVVLSGTRIVPEPCDSEQSVFKTIAMEIDYGPFLRVVPLPTEVEVDVDKAKAEQENGLLWIHLPVKTS